ncbi:hypothetical protein MASR2M70_15720 [Bacillota bacterium]
MIPFILRICILTAAAFFAGAGVVYVFNRMPAKWLCDYDEEPKKEMWGVRIHKYPYGFFFCMYFGFAGVIMWDREPLYQIAALFTLWVLLLIAISDIKYMIIPDQLIIALAVAATGFIPFQGSIMSPLFGSLAGGGSLLTIGLIGKWIFKKETMGFGDVKFIAAAGLISGIKGMVLILFMSIFAAGIVMGARLLAGKSKKDDQFPFGPFIAAFTVAYIVFRPFLSAFADWYFLW